MLRHTYEFVLVSQPYLLYDCLKYILNDNSVSRAKPIRSGSNQVWMGSADQAILWSECLISDCELESIEDAANHHVQSSRIVFNLLPGGKLVVGNFAKTSATNVAGNCAKESCWCVCSSFANIASAKMWWCRLYIRLKIHVIFVTSC